MMSAARGSSHHAAWPRAIRAGISDAVSGGRNETTFSQGASGEAIAVETEADVHQQAGGERCDRARCFFAARPAVQWW